MSESAQFGWNTVPAKAGAVFRRSLNHAGGGFRRVNERLSAADTAAPADLRRAIPRPSDRTLLRMSGWAMVIFAGLVAGLVLDLVVISPLAEHRSQTLLYNQFRAELAFGTAPVGQVDDNGQLLAMGAPVAILSVPTLGMTDTVVEGTTSRTLLDGPGHRRDTPLPGQAGISVVYGREATYGGPFGNISQLKPGDTITTTTGLGIAHYRVIDVRYPGDKAPAMPASTLGRLTLVSATGTPFLSQRLVRVDADLVGKAQPTPQAVLRPGSLTSAEDPLRSDSSGWLPMFLLLELAVAAGVLIILALRRWGKWHTWIVGVPVVLVIGVEMAKQVAVVLPNLY